MFNLFMLTIFSIFGALYVIKLIYNVSIDDFFDFIKNMWIFWCFLPIPILSIGLGFKYTKAGFKCIKNIVIGFIVSFILIVLGAFCVIPDFSYNYNKIDKYRDIIDVKLPDSGIFEVIKSDFSTMIDVQYNNKNAAYLERSIESSNNWILSTEISSPLKILNHYLHSAPD